MAFENRKYVIIPTSEISSVDFAEVLETSADTCRYSVDGTETFVKYEGAMPNSISLIPTKSQEYSHTEMLSMLTFDHWSDISNTI